MIILTSVGIKPAIFLDNYRVAQKNVPPLWLNVIKRLTKLSLLNNFYWMQLMSNLNFDAYVEDFYKILVEI